MNRFRVRAILIFVAITAVWLILIQTVEQTKHNRQITISRSQREQWQWNYQDALKSKQEKTAAAYKTRIDESIAKQLDHQEQRLTYFRSLSAESIFLTILYAGAVCLFFVIRAERLHPDSAVEPGPWDRSGPRFFRAWLQTAFVAPTGIVIVAIYFMYLKLVADLGTWSTDSIAPLLWLQLIHAVAGIVLLKGRRWTAFGIAFPSIIITYFIAAGCTRFVTGIWH